MPEIDINTKRGDPNARKDLKVFWEVECSLAPSEHKLLPCDWDTPDKWGTKPDRTRDLIIPLGKNDAGYISYDLSDDRTLMAAGGMFSGVGMFRRVSLLSLLKKHTANTLKLILIDPIKVLSDFDDIPHLLFPRVTQSHEWIKVLKWCHEESSRRLSLLEENNAMSIAHYNRLKKPSEDIIPEIVVMISEFGELMEGEENLDTLLIPFIQMTRATGIRFIITTQRPSEQILSKSLLEQFPTRIAFQMPYIAESEAFLGLPGAESLLGQGDMLVMYRGSKELLRLQGLYFPVDQTRAEVIKINEYKKC